MSLLLNKALLLFVSKYKVAWIWAWRLHVGSHYANIPSLKRTYWVKWWQKFDPKDIIGEVMDALAEHDNNQKLKSPEVDTQANNEDELLRSIIRKKILRENPIISPDELNKLIQKRETMLTDFSLEDDDNMSSQGYFDNEDMDGISLEEQDDQLMNEAASIHSKEGASNKKNEKRQNQ